MVWKNSIYLFTDPIARIEKSWDHPTGVQNHRMRSPTILVFGLKSFHLELGLSGLLITLISCRSLSVCNNWNIPKGWYPSTSYPLASAGSTTRSLTKPPMVIPTAQEHRIPPQRPDRARSAIKVFSLFPSTWGREGYSVPFLTTDWIRDVSVHHRRRYRVRKS